MVTKTANVLDGNQIRIDVNSHFHLGLFWTDVASTCSDKNGILETEGKCSRLARFKADF